MITVRAHNFSEWRQHARALMANGCKPEQVNWLAEQQGGLFDNLSPGRLRSINSELTVPKRFLSMAARAACFEDKDYPARKWALLYSLLWRLVHEHRNTLLLQSDPEVMALQRMVKAVNRDIHKMKAFVRFQTDRSSDEVSATAPSGGTPFYTAWFEPAHAIVEATAPFFAKRFTGMIWTIMTPHGCAHWDKQTLKLSPGIARPVLVEDEFELFWRAYYCRIFNPARLKEKAMMAEMPKKYWKYLPEAQCIQELTRQSAACTDKMIAAEGTDPEQAREKSGIVTKYQNALRSKNRY